jgi:hypothetical protein
MFEPGQFQSQPDKENAAAFYLWIDRKIAGARVARAVALDAFVRQAASAAIDRAWTPIRPAARTMMGWAARMSLRARRT